jgi:superfamily II DNA or RNA helicase
VPNAKFSPAFKRRVWDGKIRLLDSRKHTLFAGLASAVHQFASDNDYTIEDKTDLLIGEELSLAEAKSFVNTLNLPFVPRDYQLRAFALAVRNKRSVLISPTASGKSLIAYLITRYYNGKTLIVVPTVSLVMQMIKDFQQYGYDKEIHGVMAGVEKTTSNDITVSTWQSVYEQNAEFFEDFDVVLGDEAHLFKAKSLISIMTKMNNTEHRFGMTGTLDGAEVNSLVLQGLFGKIEKVVDTSELMAAGQLAPLKIKILVLKHPKEAKKALNGCTYQEEIDYIVACEARNKFIRNLVLSLKGNTLVLFNYVEKHGKVLYDLIKDNANHENIFWVSGKVKATDREDVREFVETIDNVTIEFPDAEITINSNFVVKLVNNTTKIASDITTEDDVDFTDIINRLSKSTSNIGKIQWKNKK